MSLLTCRTRHVHASPMTTSAATHMSGYLAPVPDEIDALDLPVDGALPPELTGRYLRNGPNPLPRAVAALVRRARNGARHPPARRSRRVVPQPLGAHEGVAGRV